MCQFLAVQSHCFFGTPATQQGIGIYVELFYRSGNFVFKNVKNTSSKNVVPIYKSLCIHMYVYICTFFQPTDRQFSLGILGQSWCVQDYFDVMLMLSYVTEWRSCLVNRVWQEKNPVMQNAVTKRYRESVKYCVRHNHRSLLLQVLSSRSLWYYLKMWQYVMHRLFASCTYTHAHAMHKDFPTHGVSIDAVPE